VEEKIAPRGVGVSKSSTPLLAEDSLRGARLSRTSLSGILVLADASLRGVSLGRIMGLADSSLRGASLSPRGVSVSLSSTPLLAEDSLRGARLSGTSLSGILVLADVSLHGASLGGPLGLDDSSLRGASLNLSAGRRLSVYLASKFLVPGNFQSTGQRKALVNSKTTTVSRLLKTPDCCFGSARSSPSAEIRIKRLSLHFYNRPGNGKLSFGGGGVQKLQQACFGDIKRLRFRLINRIALALPLDDPRRMAFFGRHGDRGVRELLLGWAHHLVPLLSEKFQVAMQRPLDMSLTIFAGNERWRQESQSRLQCAVHGGQVRQQPSCG
jgi:hypothetical protein